MKGVSGNGWALTWEPGLSTGGHLGVLLVGDQPVAAVAAQGQARELRQRREPQAPRRALVSLGVAVQRQIQEAAGRQVAYVCE